MATTSDTSVRREVVVNAPVERAFAVFTERFDTWWPRDFQIAERPAQVFVMEPRAGGRWYERAADGTECEWGEVLAWEPPSRLLLAWRISASWQYDPGLLTEVDVRFTDAGDGRTRVVLEHRGLEQYGAEAGRMTGTFGSDGGWSRVLAGYAAVVSR
ncbi:SRPBCC family protein [Jiangella rhizosphaerae]|uniref:ATPase n=1 Tax=Jiangella rhizosphaerae TaxID=2293569 RepID=A0A418KTR3_9ACTN|nr:SRPBCC family protein [Jiangella rhizosphaerae]RIQ29165.1 ATPase [Jiangella rhizosphaerae]